MTQHHLLLVGSYAAANAPGIYAFSLDSASGALTQQGAFAGVANPSFLALHPDGATLYAASETSAGDGAPGGVVALRLTRNPVALAPLGVQRTGGDWPCHLRVTPDARLLLAANYGSGTVGALPILPGGALAPLSDLAQHVGRSVHAARQEGPHAHATIIAPDGRYAIAADLGIDALVVYRLGAEGGKLAPHGQALARRGAGPRHMVFHPRGHLLYVANELDNTVSVFAYDAATGELRERQHVTTLPEGAPHSQVADIHIDEGARRLYVSNRGHNSLAVFAVAPDGGLDPLAIAPCGGDWPRNFALIPGGRFVVVANQNSGDLAVLPILADPTALGAPVARAAVPGAACVIVAGPAGV
jgi:6-phosphogluconolactonase